MKLAELEATWIVDDDVKVGLSFRCPIHPKQDDYDGHFGSVYFANPIGSDRQPYKGVPTWRRTGETFETLTLTPSIARHGACEWHGYITNGEVTTV